MPVKDDIVAKNEPRIEVENNKFLPITHTQKWPVVKEKDIKQNQEFKYPWCWPWMMKAKSLKTISD